MATTKAPKHTPLYEFHRTHGKMVEFAGYEMPIWYTSTVEEHMAVRNHAGIFDVSHMGRVDVTGPDAERFVENLFPTGIGKQPNGKSVYTLLLNKDAGIIDDLIVLKMEPGAVSARRQRGEQGEGLEAHGGQRGRPQLQDGRHHRGHHDDRGPRPLGSRGSPAFDAASARRDEEVHSFILDREGDPNRNHPHGIHRRRRVRDNRLRRSIRSRWRSGRPWRRARRHAR